MHHSSIKRCAAIGEGTCLRRLAVGVLLSMLLGGARGLAQTPPAGAAPSGTDAWPDAETLSERRRVAERRALFAQTEPLTFTLVADFRAVQRDRSPESTKTYPATLMVKRADGSDATIAMRI